MNTVVWLLISGVVGSVIGWIASIAIRAEGTQPVTLNILAGACGAMLGASALSSEFGTSLVNRGAIPLGGFGAASLGAVVSLGILFHFWRGRRT
jgi:uncharacterized membrane protein YeaQ/YmgE (transglycosylase-associated protein family)